MKFDEHGFIKEPLKRKTISIIITLMLIITFLITYVLIITNTVEIGFDDIFPLIVLFFLIFLLILGCVSFVLWPDQKYY